MKPPADWEIREAREADVGAVVELLRRGLGEGAVPRTEAFWRWKHLAGPFGPSPVLVAEADGHLVGVRAFLRWRWSLAGPDGGERSVPAVRAVDTVTHPDWRGRGLFRELTRELVERVAAEGAAFVFNTPNALSGAGYLKMGWTEVGRLPLYARPLRIHRLPAALPAALLARVGFGMRLDRAAAGGAPGDEGADSAVLADAGEPVQSFLQRPTTASLLDRIAAHPAMSEPRYRTVPTAEYLGWRYADVPGLAYRALADEAGAAALVLRGRRRRGLAEVSVSDVLAAPGADGQAAATTLLRRLGAATGGDYAVAVASPGTPEHAALRGAGFLRLPAAGPPFFARPLPTAPAAPPLTEPTSWRWTTGSCELF